MPWGRVRESLGVSRHFIPLSLIPRASEEPHFHHSIAYINLPAILVIADVSLVVCF